MTAPQFQIKITEEVVMSSERRVPGRCIIAQALRMQHNARSLNVQAGVVSFVADIKGIPHRCMYEPSSNMKKFIVQWDEGALAPLGKIFQFPKTGMCQPVMKRPNAKKRGPTKKRPEDRVPTVKKCIRRYHGIILPVELVPAEIVKLK